MTAVGFDFVEKVARLIKLMRRNGELLLSVELDHVVVAAHLEELADSGSLLAEDSAIAIQERSYGTKQQRLVLIRTS